MSWTDKCKNCGEQRSDCECGNWEINRFNPKKNKCTDILVDSTENKEIKTKRT